MNKTQNALTKILPCELTYEKCFSGGLILSLEKFGLILYFNFLQKNIYVVKS